MIKIFKNSKIYVHAPYKVVTGGVELCFQLVDYINKNGGSAYIVYSYYGNEHGKDIPDDYKKYNIQIAESIEDNPENVEVFNESESIKDLHKNKTIQKFIWWMSIDNFFSNNLLRLSNRDIIFGVYEKPWRSLAKKIYNRLKGLKKHSTAPKTLKIKDLVDMNISHGFQSEYAQYWLQNNGFKEVVALKDYINTDHMEYSSENQRENIVLYNPKKGYKFTNELIKNAPDIKWVPLINMTRSEVVETMRKAKVYIDFGNHPGKDRLPRECAINGCCIITGLRGSAKFYEDVSIDSQYKFDERTSDIHDIILKIKELLENYDERTTDFDLYRKRILEEKEEFENQVQRLFLTHN